MTHYGLVPTSSLARVFSGRLWWIVGVVLLFFVSAPARAGAASPHWIVLAQAEPTQLHQGDPADVIEVIAENDGAATTEGETTVTAELPLSLTVGKVLGSAEAHEEGEEFGRLHPFSAPCGTSATATATVVTCTTSQTLAIGASLDVDIQVAVAGGAVGPLRTAVKVTGGGATEPGVSKLETMVTPSSQPVPFGAQMANDLVSGTGEDHQAASHPFAFTNIIAFNSGSVQACNSTIFEETIPCPILNSQPRDVEVALPPGFVGNPNAMPKCSQTQFQTPSFRSCPADTQVGDAFLYFYGARRTQYAPVYNVEPPEDQPAELGFTVSTIAHIPLFFHVRSDGDYGLTVDANSISQYQSVRMIALTVWGVPADPAHDVRRSSQLGSCVEPTGCSSGIQPAKPFLTAPSSCSSEPLPISLRGDSWQMPETGPFGNLGADSLPALTGCAQVPFAPMLSVSSSSTQPSVPAGYRVVVGVSQSESSETLAAANVREVSVALPAGTTLSPSAANGLVACSESQFGWKRLGRGSCPAESEIGKVKIVSPLLSAPLVGRVYVGEPECHPCSPGQAEAGQLLPVLIEAEGAGVVVKLRGSAKINQATGQVTTVFGEAPQLPFNAVEVSLEPGPGAALVNPSACGPAVASGFAVPWSTTSASAMVSQPVPVSGCAASAFAPSLRAGMTTSAAAASFSPFDFTLQRQDGQQDLGGVSIKMPEGLLGVIRGVPRCGEAEADAGTCSAASQIGVGSVLVGPGSDPFEVAGSRVYLTGPYGGAPFGLSIVTPAQAGPFLLSGNTGGGAEVVRASISVDPQSSALTITAGRLPDELDGIPLHIRAITVEVTREHFMLNATSCNQASIGGTVSSTTGAVAPISYPYQAVNCAQLPFAPKLTALSSATASKKLGASLHVHLTSGVGQANIAKVKVDLPLQLPSRLSTLNKACDQKVFAVDPGGCPAGSVVGWATALSPILSGKLVGPAYVVSHAGLAFPDIDVVLQGEGVTLVLTGNTVIKHGITTSAFRSVPDAPVSSFDLVLPQGPHSILAVYGSLCAGALKMPTEITGQNGAVIKKTTTIAVNGCSHVRHAGRKLRPLHKA